jgi:hypothetical protein
VVSRLRVCWDAALCSLVGMLTACVRSTIAPRETSGRLLRDYTARRLRRVMSMKLAVLSLPRAVSSQSSWWWTSPFISQLWDWLPCFSCFPQSVRILGYDATASSRIMFSTLFATVLSLFAISYHQCSRLMFIWNENIQKLYLPLFIMRQVGHSCA